MSEHPPSPEPRGRFLNPRDALLHAMTMGEWSCESSGSVESPSGWFAWLSNSVHELDDIRAAFAEDIERLGLTDVSELVGHWTVHEDNLGFVECIKYDTEDQAKAVYTKLEEMYETWPQDQP